MSKREVKGCGLQVTSYGHQYVVGVVCFRRLLLCVVLWLLEQRQQQQQQHLKRNNYSNNNNNNNYTARRRCRCQRRSRCRHLKNHFCANYLYFVLLSFFRIVIYFYPSLFPCNLLFPALSLSFSLSHTHNLLY